MIRTNNPAHKASLENRSIIFLPPISVIQIQDKTPQFTGPLRVREQESYSCSRV
jgi:hypothetical protein